MCRLFLLFRSHLNRLRLNPYFIFEAPLLRIKKKHILVPDNCGETFRSQPGETDPEITLHRPKRLSGSSILHRRYAARIDQEPASHQAASALPDARWSASPSCWIQAACSRRAAASCRNRSLSYTGSSKSAVNLAPLETKPRTMQERQVRRVEGRKASEGQGGPRLVGAQ